MLPKKTLHIVIAGIVIVGLIAIGKAPLIRELHAWQVLPRSERFTQLYFGTEPHPKRLPSEGGKQKMAFVVQSHEQQVTNYHYKIFASSEDAKFKKLLADGSFSLAHDKSITVNRTLSLPKLDARMAVKIELEYDGTTFDNRHLHTQQQSIHYWLETLNAAPGNGGA